MNSYQTSPVVKTLFHSEKMLSIDQRRQLLHYYYPDKISRPTSLSEKKKLRKKICTRRLYDVMYLCISIQKAHFLMVSTTSLLQGLKYMIITLDIKIIIIKQEVLEPFKITQSELVGQYFRIHWTTTLESQIR